MTQANVQQTDSTIESGGAVEQSTAIAEEVMDRTRDIAATAGEQAGDVAATVKDEATHVAADARDHAIALLEEGRKQTEEQALAQRDRLVGTLQTVGNDLEQMSTGARSGMAADLTRQLADKVRHLSTTIESKQPSELLSDVRSFAQRKPSTFLLGALAAGVVAGRLLRSGTNAASKPTTDRLSEASSAETHSTSMPTAPHIDPSPSDPPPATTPGLGIPVQSSGAALTDGSGDDLL